MWQHIAGGRDGTNVCTDACLNGLLHVWCTIVHNPCILFCVLDCKCNRKNLDAGPAAQE